MRKPSNSLAFGLLVGLLANFASQSAGALTPKEEALATYAHYLAASETRRKAEATQGVFFYVDALPERDRARAYARLHRGEVLLKQMDTAGDERNFEAQQSLVHDWIGLVFIPNATLAQTMAVVQNYNNYQTIYKPGMRHSRLIGRDGDLFHVSLQLDRKAFVTVAFNALFDIQYQRLGPGRIESHARATRLAEVADAGQANEHEISPDRAHGLLWGLNDYWHFEQKDNGVYVQLETIELSRSVPPVIAWLANPLIESVPRGILSSLLSATRNAILDATRKNLQSSILSK